MTLEPTSEQRNRLHNLSSGKVEGVLVGGQNSSPHDDWSAFAMVFYRSRANFLRLMTHSPLKGIQHRSAGLARAVLMPSSNNL